MKEIEVLRFKSKLEGKRVVFNSSSLLDSEWDSMLEKAKLESKFMNDQERSRSSYAVSMLCSLRLSAALSFVLLAVLLVSFAFSSSLTSKDQGNSRAIRQRRSVPVINVSNRYI